MLRMICSVSALVVCLVFATAANASVESRQHENVSPRAHNDFTLTFKGEVDLRRTKIRVFGVMGEVQLGKAHLGDRRQDLVIPLANELKPGLYFVTFDAYSIMGDRAVGTSELLIPDAVDDTVQPVAEIMKP